MRDLRKVNHKIEPQVSAEDTADRLLGKWQSRFEAWCGKRSRYLGKTEHYVEAAVLDPATMLFIIAVLLLPMVAYGKTLFWGEEINLPGESNDNKSSVDILNNAIFLNFIVALFGAALLKPVVINGGRKLVGPYYQNQLKFKRYFAELKEIVSDPAYAMTTDQNAEAWSIFLEFHQEMIAHLIHGRETRYADRHDKLPYWKAVAYILADFEKELPHASYPVEARQEAVQQEHIYDDVIEENEEEDLDYDFDNDEEAEFVDDAPDIVARFFRQAGARLDQVDADQPADAQVAQVAGQNLQPGQALRNLAAVPTPFAAIPQARALLDDQADSASNSDRRSERSADAQHEYGELAIRPENVIDPWALPLLPEQIQAECYGDGADENNYQVINIEKRGFFSRERNLCQQARKTGCGDGDATSIALLNYQGNITAQMHVYVGKELRKIRSRAERAQRLSEVLTTLLKQKTGLNSDFYSQAINFVALLKEAKHFDRWEHFIQSNAVNTEAFSKLSRFCQVKLIHILLCGPDCAKLTALSLVHLMPTDAFAAFMKKLIDFYFTGGAGNAIVNNPQTLMMSYLEGKLGDDQVTRGQFEQVVDYLVPIVNKLIDSFGLNHNTLGGSWKDYFWDRLAPTFQNETIRKRLALAYLYGEYRRHGKPNSVLFCRKSHDDVAFVERCKLFWQHFTRKNAVDQESLAGLDLPEPFKAWVLDLATARFVPLAALHVQGDPNETRPLLF